MAYFYDTNFLCETLLSREEWRTAGRGFQQNSLLTKNDLNTVLGRHLFSIANDCSVNLSDLSKMLVKKQMKYFDVPLDHAWKVPVLQELLNTRTNNLYVEGFDDYVITEMINMLCNE